MGKEMQGLRQMIAQIDQKPKRDSNMATNSSPQQVASTKQLFKLQDGQTVQISGTISQLQSKVTKAGRPMVFLTMKDHDGEVEALVFPDAYAKCAQEIRIDSKVVVTGAINLREDKPKIYATNVMQCSAIPTGRTQTRQPTACAQQESKNNNQ